MHDAIIEEFNLHLSNLYVLYVKLHNYHWNVTGKGFYTLHEQLEHQYDDTAKQIDAYGERIIMMKGTPLASMQSYLVHAQLKEAGSGCINDEDIIRDLYCDYETMHRHLKKLYGMCEEIDDFISESLLADSIAQYEKYLWMMKAYLK